MHCTSLLGVCLPCVKLVLLSIELTLLTCFVALLATLVLPLGWLGAIVLTSTTCCGAMSSTLLGSVGLLVDLGDSSAGGSGELVDAEEVAVFFVAGAEVALFGDQELAVVEHGGLASQQ